MSKSIDSFGRLTKRLIGQLDTLVPFLALSHREIFDVLREEYQGWYTDDRRSTLPDTFREYGYQVSHAAFLLGYSYAEGYVTDLVYELYNSRRDLMPSERLLPFGEVLQHTDFESVIRHMVESTIGEMNSLEAKISHLENKFGWKLPEFGKLKDAHVARNALVHNAGLINRKPPSGSRWNRGDTVKLNVDDVHDLGVTVRALALGLEERARAVCRTSRRRFQG